MFMIRLGLELHVQFSNGQDNFFPGFICWDKELHLINYADW